MLTTPPSSQPQSQSDTTTTAAAPLLFTIHGSPISGRGAFAACDIPPHQVILREPPLLLVTAHTSLCTAFERLDDADKHLALGLCANEDRYKDGTPKIQAIWATNSFATQQGQGGLFPVSARFNHACRPGSNVDYYYDNQNNELVLKSGSQAIKKEQELTISYMLDASPAQLYAAYGFQCRCGYCPGLSNENLRKMLDNLW
ncbi:hypothetical protein VHEMI04788 [[Torrubiella] hemipterigena]|uniref:SET domain-containing protein n=1 Tax=[Torrubiella] hemipterigena TaxID=1531966 RepID=A0A0A1TH44_9HYPO|nr:hypothetical protein VHEMI04788 [[Torrubiella] hemipterigena]